MLMNPKNQLKLLFQHNYIFNTSILSNIKNYLTEDNISNTKTTELSDPPPLSPSIEPDIASTANKVYTC